jgi:general secretion pathway protein G
VVLAIIAVLASFVAPSLFRNVGDARQATAATQIESIGLALSNFRIDLDRYPSTPEGIAALRTMPTSLLDGGRWRGPYLAKATPVDPWGRPYVYLAPGTSSGEGFDLYTLGRDGQVGGAGEDKDITSWGGPLR